MNARSLGRYDSNDILKQIRTSYIDRGGDGKGPNRLHKCLRCGLGTLQGCRRLLVLKWQHNRALVEIVEKKLLHVHVPHLFNVQTHVEVPQVAYVDKLVDVSFLFAA